MFGYVVINKPEIKFKDFDLYRSFYCGLCRELRERYGISGQISITYDMTFVLMLLGGLYEPPTQKGITRCALHPVRPQQVRRNEITQYVADMNILLTYYKCMDDWKDEKKYIQYGYAALLRAKNKKFAGQYREKAEKIAQYLRELSTMERAGEKDLDKVSGCSGKILEEVFVFRKDMWEPALRKMGFYLGKFIYLLDAYEDVEEDIKNQNYNPFSAEYRKDGFEEHVRQILMMMMAEVCREFEKLPIIKYTDILRNILYSGVWRRFEAVSRKRREAREKEHV